MPALRVLVVGDSSCGKTSLCALLASTGESVACVARTQGCDVHIRLLHCPPAGGGAAAPHFIELWDVDAGGPLCPLLLGCQLFAGVLLCHDLSRRGGAASLARWAQLLGTHGRWAEALQAVPLSPRTGKGGPLAARLRELGVQVPTLVLGLKADLAEAAAAARQQRSGSSLLSRLLSHAMRPAAALFAFMRCRRGARPSAEAATGPLLPEHVSPSTRDEAIFAADALRCAASLGRLDFDFVDAFFRALLLTYPCSQPGAALALSRNGSFDFQTKQVGEEVPLTPTFGAAQQALGADEDGRMAWGDDGA